MAKIFAVVLALFAIQGCLGKPAKQADKTAVEELVTKAKTLIDDVSKKIEKDLPDNKKVVESLNTQTKAAATTVQNFVNKLKQESKAHEGEFNAAVKQLEAKLTETAAALQKAAGPEATAKANELKTTLDTNLKTTVAEIEKLVKKVEPDVKGASDNIYKWAQDALNDIVKVGKNLQTEVKTQIEAHEKTHKH